MSLELAVAAIADILAAVHGVDQVLADPPARLPDPRCIVLFEAPGESTALAHGGSNGAMVYQNLDTIIVEYHLKFPSDAVAVSSLDARQMLDRARDALWSGMQRTGVGGQAIAVRAIRTEFYGSMGWGDDTTFGFRLGVDLTHAAESSAGGPP